MEEGGNGAEERGNGAEEGENERGKTTKGTVEGRAQHTRESPWMGGKAQGRRAEPKDRG